MVATEVAFLAVHPDAIDFDEPPGLDGLPRCAGWVDNTAGGADGWTLCGWAALPSSGPSDAIRANWNGAAP
jgi:hypothetical protein